MKGLITRRWNDNLDILKTPELYKTLTISPKRYKEISGEAVAAVKLRKKIRIWVSSFPGQTVRIERGGISKKSDFFTERHIGRGLEGLRRAERLGELPPNTRLIVKTGPNRLMRQHFDSVADLERYLALDFTPKHTSAKWTRDKIIASFYVGTLHEEFQYEHPSDPELRAKKRDAALWFYQPRMMVQHTRASERRAKKKQKK